MELEDGGVDLIECILSNVFDDTCSARLCDLGTQWLPTRSVSRLVSRRLESDPLVQHTDLLRTMLVDDLHNAANTQYQLVFNRRISALVAFEFTRLFVFLLDVRWPARGLDLLTLVRLALGVLAFVHAIWMWHRSVGRGNALLSSDPIGQRDRAVFAFVFRAMGGIVAAVMLHSLWPTHLEWLIPSGTLLLLLVAIMLYISASSDDVSPAAASASASSRRART